MNNFLNFIAKIIIVACVIIAILLAIILYLTTSSNNDQHDPVDLIDTNSTELQYWNTKYELVSEVQSYINSVAKTSELNAYKLVELTDKYGIDVKFVLAQGEIESHFGTKGLAKRTNSVWNVGATDSITLSNINDSHKFKNPNESIEPYLKLLTTKYLVNRSEVDLFASFTNTDGKRYASSPEYESKLKYKYLKIARNTKIDSLSSQLRIYATRCGR